MPNKISTKLTTNKPRIESLDVIRGFAILGILLMNIQIFSMVGQAYINPMAYGNMTGLNKWIWIGSHVVADQKFMSIFSMLFGASIIMITQGAEDKTGHSAGIHYKRNFWLLVIGLAHSYLLWYGDILTPYAICAFLLYFFRKLSVKKLLITGIIVFSVGSIIYLLLGLSLLQAPAQVVSKLTNSWLPSQKVVQAEVNAYLGNFIEQTTQRTKTSNMMHSTVFLTFYLWRISGLMLIGMALFKSGFLSGQLSTRFYRKILIIAGTSGLFLVVYGVFKNFAANWTLLYSMFLGSQFNYWGSLLMAFAYISAIILLVQSGKLKPVTQRFAAIGRMALSNYLSQTLICTFIFYGFGLGLFGQVNRSGQLLIVLGVWALQLIVSPLWLKYFRFGIFEWLWRSATYAKIQVLVK